MRQSPRGSGSTKHNNLWECSATRDAPHPLIVLFYLHSFTLIIVQRLTACCSGTSHPEVFGKNSFLFHYAYKGWINFRLNFRSGVVHALKR